MSKRMTATSKRGLAEPQQARQDTRPREQRRYGTGFGEALAALLTLKS